MQKCVYWELRSSIITSLTILGGRKLNVLNVLVQPSDLVFVGLRKGMEWKEGNVLFNDALNTFYLLLYGVGQMVKDRSGSERKPAAATT